MNRCFLLTWLLLLAGGMTALAGKNLVATGADSLQADVESTFIYNNVRIANLLRDSAVVHTVTIVPAGWKLLSPPETDLMLAGKETGILSITINKKVSSSAEWSPVLVCITSADSATDTLRFYIRANAYSSFRITAEDPEIDTQKKHTINTRVYLKNTGNVPGKYYCSLNSENLRMAQHYIIRLKGGEDTSCILSYKVPLASWRALNEADIQFAVWDSLFQKRTQASEAHGAQSMTPLNQNASSSYFSTLHIIREDSSVYEHPSGFPLLKLNLEAGYISYNGVSSYFAAAAGILPIGKSSTLSFDYHSRQFGLYNILDRDVYNIYFTSSHWRVHAGQVNDGKYFRTYGTGLSASYLWGRKSGSENFISVFGVRHTPGFYANNDNGGINMRLLLGKVAWSQSILFNTDSGAQLNSYLYTTELSLARSSRLELSITGGAGLVQNSLHNNTLQSGDTWGGYGGYRLSYRPGAAWSFSSSANYYSGHFPGFNSGAQNMAHSLSYRLKKFRVEAYYQYDVRPSNFYKDTIYNSDVLTYNIQKYGLRIGGSTKKSGASIGGGIIHQEGQQSYSFAPDYTFGELQYNFHARRRFVASLNTLVGFAPIAGDAGILATASGNLTYRVLGISGGYSHIPVLQKDNQEQQHIAYNTETMYGGPYLSFTFLRHVAANVQYSISKTLYDDGISSFANINLSYENQRNGIRFLVNASAPLQRPNATSTNPVRYGYFNISLHKMLNAPFIFKRKYHNLSARFFTDENNNGLLDGDEQVLSGMPVMINDRHMITDRNGYIHYRNLDKGSYKMDMGNSPVKGYIPGTGYNQTIEVTRNRKLDFGYRRGKTISGHISILQDSTSEGYFSAANLKIIARDSAQHEYSTITNNSGDYFISLPAGSYIVSLNPAAFNEFWKPVTLSRSVQLGDTGSAIADFEIKQRKRTMKILKTDGEVILKNIKEQKQEVGKVPLTKEEIEHIRMLQAQSNHTELRAPDEKESKLLDQATRLAVQRNHTNAKKQAPLQKGKMPAEKRPSKP